MATLPQAGEDLAQSGTSGLAGIATSSREEILKLVISTSSLEHLIDKSAW